jgi:hypothetical protein
VFIWKVLELGSPLLHLSQSIRCDGGSAAGAWEALRAVGDNPFRRCELLGWLGDVIPDALARAGLGSGRAWPTCATKPEQRTSAHGCLRGQASPASHGAAASMCSTSGPLEEEVWRLRCSPRPRPAHRATAASRAAGVSMSGLRSGSSPGSTGSWVRIPGNTGAFLPQQRS